MGSETPESPLPLPPRGHSEQTPSGNLVLGTMTTLTVRMGFVHDGFSTRSAAVCWVGRPWLRPPAKDGTGSLRPTTSFCKRRGGHRGGLMSTGARTGDLASAQLSRLGTHETAVVCW